MVFNSILLFLDSVFLEGNGIFGFLGGGSGQAALGSDDPIVKGIVLTVFGVTGFGILLNLFNAAVRKKMVDQTKLQRIMKETRSWQKERMAAMRSKDQGKIDDLNKKSSYMNKMSMEMMQMNMRPMMYTFVPLILIFYFILPHLFAYTVAISPIDLNFVPGNFFQLTCTAAKVAESQLPNHPQICHHVNEMYFWAWYFLSSIAFSGIIMRLTKTTMDTD